MNNILSYNRFEDYAMPALENPQARQSTSGTGKQDGDVQGFHVLYPSESSTSRQQLPERRDSVLDVDQMVVPISLMRRIESELKEDRCDARTVFSSCRGLERGSREFEDAYIEARIRAVAKNPRYCKRPLNDIQGEVGPQQQIRWATGKGMNCPPPPHPMAVLHLRHLMSHMGIWVCALLGTQVLAAWRLGAFVNVYLDGGRMFYFTVGIVTILTLDSALWLHLRGNHCKAFLVPGMLLFLMAALPILILHIAKILMA